MERAARCFSSETATPACVQTPSLSVILANPNMFLLSILSLLSSTIAWLEALELEMKDKNHLLP